ncbi:P-loop containing nucleoside triphosphate hydrolase protein [Suillus subalutaceus]|uniref:P-loop containing nucleoside triphosphate hydrolase protein n=1 Tax=Suillus subalutaceus TaxID=48586 RepID=UPI001B85DAF6|nr:P-loop containing nucleoside triphosphate hydrolase protein [Suillus subalutaceus]KAG1856384.1 P-loop containing nucleoside triphosphate hydrolase protein [Suillus subalutaceus]
MSDRRAALLNKRFYDVLKGKVSIEPRNCHLFLDSICSQPDVAVCVSRIVGESKGPSIVQEAMRLDLSAEFMNGIGADVLVYLLQATSISSNVLDHLFIQIVEPDFFWSAFSHAFARGELLEKAQRAFASLLLRLLNLSNHDTTPYLELAGRPNVLPKLTGSENLEVRLIGEKIKHILSTYGSSAPPPAANGPGGRHDNDFVNFREIAILPTADEIRSGQLPFLRRSSELEDEFGESTRIADYLDNTFRLLREDMIAEMREELQALEGKNVKRRRANLIDGVILKGVYHGTDDRKMLWGITLECADELPSLKRIPPKDRKAYLTDDYAGSKILRHQSLVCVVVDNEVVGFGTVNRVEDFLIRSPPIIVIQLDGRASTSRTILRLRNAKNAKLLQIDTALFAFEPVLKALQKTQHIPVSDELLFWKRGVTLQNPPQMADDMITAIEADRSGNLQHLLQTPNPIQLDSSQALSILSGLTQRVSLIQGPPGTGKSFVGALLAKALHDFTDQTILVVCYTNHALDQFLDDLIKIGIPDDHMVRLGGRAKPQLAHLNLFSPGQRTSQPPRTKADWTMIDEFRTRLKFLCSRLDNSIAQFMANRIRYEDILTHIEFEDESYFEAFRIPRSDDGMATVGRGGREVDPTYLIALWERGCDAGIFKHAAHLRTEESSRIWTTPLPVRKNMLAKWTNDLQKQMVEDVGSVGRDYNSCQIDLARKFGESLGATLQAKRIIACTTTGAAKFTEDLRTAAPDVVLVEEAGEILESHILTAFGANTNQLILIGDHKYGFNHCLQRLILSYKFRQLRPKVNSYALQVESDRGYDLNRSLFERLVLKGFPHATLTEQHRMRPEISALVRELTYPELTDAASTRGRDDIRGIQDNIIFVNHAHPEDNEGRVSDRSDLGSTTSKQNSYEASMVLKIVRYLAQQGYGTDNIVVLTPYLGQLSKLREYLKADNDPVLNDLDSYDLVRAGLLSPDAAKASKRKIRLATIDNYQGEESDIVVTSLTRSNPDGAIGFMKSPERLNVLLSRARDGLILIGNMDTFESKSTLWSRLFSLLRQAAHIYEGFPVKCERHPARKAILRDANDFDDRCPDGGCLEPCGAMLSCNVHPCPSKCHQLSDHSKILCQQVLFGKCTAGVHKVSWKCHQGPRTKCTPCEKDADRTEKQLLHDAELQQKRDAGQAAFDTQMAEMDARLKTEVEVIADTNTAKQREAMFKQKEREIEDAKVRAQKLAGSSKDGSANPSKPTTSPSQQSSNPLSTQTALSQPPGSQKSSAARDDWESQKKLLGEQNDAIDSIMAMTGLEGVKSQVLQTKEKLDLMKRQGIPANKERLNLALLGNPGTGKTTVARLYAQFLESIQILPGSTFKETTGASLAHDGVGGAKKLIEDVMKVGGGAIFIDEAYQLVSAQGGSGTDVLDFLLAEMENRVGGLVFILAGYSRQMEKFFNHNQGLPSRVPHRFTFEDYTDEELLDIGQMKVEEGIRGLYSRIAVRRLGRGRGREGFGNARALQNMFAQIRQRQAARVGKERKNGSSPDDFLLVKEDLIGPNPDSVLPQCPSWIKLQKLTGLESVKQSVSNLFNLIRTNYHRELTEKQPLNMALNRVFLGSPGTGKTTVAKLYGQALADLGLLSNGEVVVKNPSDFVGQHLGQSEQNTKAILESTVGKVLVIDEAYMLHSKNGGAQDPYKTGVIDTMVAEIQNVPGDDRCVLLLGYKEQMEDMFKAGDVNPGFARRFAIEDAFMFEDFNEPQLQEIFERKLHDQDLSATEKAKQVALGLLSRRKNRPNFGNGGEVENMLTFAKDRYLKRQASQPSHLSQDIVFEPEDFDTNWDRDQHAVANLAQLFEDMVGCEAVIQRLGDYQSMAQGMKASGLDMRKQIPTSFIFKGPPGTGKTTIARKFGQVYYDMGFLASTELVECSASDLVGEYVGQTGPKTKKLFEKAIGKVLFVDEAYRLSQGHFAQEAIDEVVGLMTNEKFMGKMVIILAGYEKEMNQLLGANPGLSSRFSEDFILPNMSSIRCLELLDKDLRGSKVVVQGLSDPSSSLYEEMLSIIADMASLENWGNARDVKSIAKRLARPAFISAGKAPGSSLVVTSEDALNIMRCQLSEQRERLNLPNKTVSSTPGVPQMAMSRNIAPPPPSTSQNVSTSAPPKPPASKPSRKRKRTQQQPKPPFGGTPPQDTTVSSQVQRDPGVDDATWTRLQADKAAGEAAEKDAAEELRKRNIAQLKALKKLRAAEAAAQKLAQKLANDNANEQLMRQREAARIRELEAKAAREKALAELKKKQQEAERKRREEARVQQKLREMGMMNLPRLKLQQMGVCKVIDVLVVFISFRMTSALGNPGDSDYPKVT